MGDVKSIVAYGTAYATASDNIPPATASAWREQNLASIQSFQLDQEEYT
jgi:hypothetical protein